MHFPAAASPLSVLPDELTGGHTAVELLCAAGHLDGIALIGHNRIAEQGLFRSDTVGRRIAGIHAAMAKHKLQFATEESCWEWDCRQHGFELTRKVLAQHPDVTALLCLNDRLALRRRIEALAEVGRGMFRATSPSSPSTMQRDHAGYPAARELDHHCPRRTRKWARREPPVELLLIARHQRRAHWFPCR